MYCMSVTELCVMHGISNEINMDGREQTTKKRFTLQRPAAHSDAYVVMDHTLLRCTRTSVTGAWTPVPRTQRCFSFDEDIPGSYARFFSLLLLLLLVLPSTSWD